MVRSLAPAVLSRGSRRGQNSWEAPLVRLRDAPDTRLAQCPSKGQRGRAMEWQGTNTCPPSQCRLSFALFNLCVFVNLAAWFVLQVLWPSKLVLGRMKLSGCPAVLAVFREGALLFERLLLETIRAESSLYLNESKQKTKAVRKQLASVQDH